jgi:hypothetical protein
MPEAGVALIVTPRLTWTSTIDVAVALAESVTVSVAE